MSEPSTNGHYHLNADPAEHVEAIISDLAAEVRPHVPPGDGEMRDLARLAGTLRGALRPDADPAPDFARTLRDRLEADLFGAEDAAPIPMHASPAPPATPQRRAPSRRQLVRGGLVAAAGMAAGLVAGVELNHPSGTTAPPSSPSGPWTEALVGGTGAWLTVAQVAEVAAGSAVRFSTAQVVGHLVRYADGTFAAFAAACTHMGCIVNWNATARTFDCPCHNGRFDAHGQAVPGRIIYRPLPQMQTRVLANAVQVYVPTTEEPGDEGTYNR